MNQAGLLPAIERSSGLRMCRALRMARRAPQVALVCGALLALLWWDAACSGRMALGAQKPASAQRTHAVAAARAWRARSLAAPAAPQRLDALATARIPMHHELRLSREARRGHAAVTRTALADLPDADDVDDADSSDPPDASGAPALHRDRGRHAAPPRSDGPRPWRFTDGRTPTHARAPPRA